MSKTSDFAAFLSERGFTNQITCSGDELSALTENPITAYIGFDLTASSLHVGSLIQLMVLRALKLFGHTPLALTGDATTRVGDPTGKDRQRPQLTGPEISRNKSGIAANISQVVGDIEFVSNERWFNDDTRFFDFLNKFGNHFTINRMLTLDSVKARLDRQSPMTFFEFNYMLLQAVDFLELYQRHNCVLQIGGSDQWGNIVNGVDLIRRVTGQSAYGATTPLLTNAAGEKMGKTSGGAVWLNSELTSPFEFWQFWRNVEDSKVEQFLGLFTDLPMSEVAKLSALQGDEMNDAKIALARNVTQIVHGITDPENGIPEHRVTAGTSIRQILFDAKLVSSKLEADRLARDNGLRLNGELVSNAHDILVLTDSETILSVGKKRRVRLVGTQDGREVDD